MADRPIIFSAPMVRALLDGRKTQTRRVLTPQPAVYTPRVIDITTPFFCEEEGNWGQVQTIWSTHSYMWEPEREVWRPLKGLRWAVGDRLWVREAHAILPRTAYRASVGTGTIDQREHPTDGYTAAVFREGFDRSGRPLWRPSIHMPRWASRLTLAVAEVRVERLQDISEADARAEGVEPWETEREQHDWSVCPKCGGTTVHGALGHSLGVHEVDCRDCDTSAKRFRHLWNSINGPDAWDANPWVAAISFTVHRANIDALDLGVAA